jgi:hypothetical protein
MFEKMAGSTDRDRLLAASAIGIGENPNAAVRVRHPDAADGMVSA